MAAFYHIDKDSFSHQIGAEVPLMLPPLGQLPALTEARLKFWRSQFSTEGFSFFGYRMLRIINWAEITLDEKHKVAIHREITFEEVREREFPNRPSRFQSMFGFEHKNDALLYRTKSGHPEWPLWTVDASEYFMGDLHLYNDARPTEFPSLAQRYWAGDRTSEPLVEVLMKLPVRITGKVEF